MHVENWQDTPEHPRIRPVAAFRDNYIWVLRSPDSRRCAVVDPGDAAVVQQHLAAEGLTLAWILVTHHHADHTGGIAALKTPGVRVVGPGREPIPGRDIAVGDGDLLELDGLDCRIEVLDVPGHTAGHVAYRAELDGIPVLFPGDTLFCGGCGRLFEGTAEEMHASLQRLAALPAGTLVYCAHEYTLGNLWFAAAVEPDNEAVRACTAWASRRREAGLPTVPGVMGRERQVNPFLRTDQPAVAAAATARTGTAALTPAAVFAEIRRWKDGFH